MSFLLSLVAASSQAEFDAAQVTEGFGNFGFLQQPILSAKLQQDVAGCVRGFLKDLNQGHLCYTKMDFAPGGVPIQQQFNCSPSGSTFPSTMEYFDIAKVFIAPPQDKEPEVDNILFSQRLTHEGDESDSDGTLSLQGVRTGVSNGLGKKLSNDLNENAVSRRLASEVLEVYRMARPAGDKLCLSILRRDPPKSRTNKIRPGITVKEQCRSYSEALAEADLNGLSKNFEHSEEKQEGRRLDHTEEHRMSQAALRRRKRQFWKMCFGDMCTLSEKITKGVMVVRKGKRDGDTKSVHVDGSYVYKYYSGNENKAKVVEFATLEKECTGETPLPSPSDAIKYSKCGDIVKAQMGEHIYLMKDSNGTLEEATNVNTCKFEKLKPADTKANEKFNLGVQETEVNGEKLVAGNGYQATDYPSTSHLVTFGVALFM